MLNRISVLIIARICSKVNRNCHVIVTLSVWKTPKSPRKFSKCTNGEKPKSPCGSKENSIFNDVQLISLLGFPSREGGFDSRILLQKREHPQRGAFFFAKDYLNGAELR